MVSTSEPVRTIRQGDIGVMLAQGRISDYPVAMRSAREVLGGGFADTRRHPNTWTVLFLVDGGWAAVESARGLRREWASLDRLERWLRGQGFRLFWVRNDMDPIEAEAEFTGGANMK